MNPDIDDVKFNATSSRYRDNRASSPTKTRAFEHTSKPKPITSYLDASHANMESVLNAVSRRFVQTRGVRDEFPLSTIREVNREIDSKDVSASVEELEATMSPKRSPKRKNKKIMNVKSKVDTGRNTNTAEISEVADKENAVILNPTDDPVSFFAKHKDGPVKFIYLNRVKEGLDSNPYRLKMVSFNEIDKDYYTMSSNGITFVRSDGYTEFTPMAEWVREADVFQIISRLEVFRNYRYWKCFRKWRSYIRKRRLKANKLRLEHSLLMLKPIFYKYLNNLMRLCETELLKVELLPIRAHSNYSLNDFQHAFGSGANTHRRFGRQQLSELFEVIIQLLERLVAEVCDPERIKVSTDEFKLKARRKISLRQLMLLEKKKTLEQARITNQINTEIMMIGNFIRLCDTIILEYLVKLVLQDFSHFLATLQTEKSTIFTTNAMFDSNANIEFTPNVETVKGAVFDVMRDTVSLLSSLPRVLYHPTFEKYVTIGQKSGSTSESFNIQRLLMQIDAFNSIQVSTREVIDNSFNSAQTYAKHFSEFRSVFLFGKDWDIQKYKDSKPDLDQFSADLVKFNKWAQSMERIQPSATRGILYIDSKMLKGSLTPIPSRGIDDLKQLLASIASEKTSNLLDIFKNAITSLSTEPGSLEEYVEFVKLYNPLSEKVNQCADEIQLTDDMYTLLDENGFNPSSGDLERHSLIHTIFSRFKESLSSAQVLKKRLYPTYAKILEKNTTEAAENLQAINIRLQSQSFADPKSIPNSLLLDLADIRSQVVVLKAKIDKYAEYHVILEIPPSDAIEGIKVTVETLERIETLWNTVNKWQQMEEVYNTTPFVTLKKEDISNDLQSVYQKAKDLVAWSPSNLVAKHMLEKIEHYQKMLPHILLLANTAIRHRHWAKLFAAVGQHYEDDTVFTLVQLKSYGAFNHETLIRTLSTLASGEHALEVGLENIEQFWLKASFELIPYHNKTKSLYILSGVEEIQRHLQDHEITLTSMLNSEYISGIQSKVENLKNKLSYISDILDQWVDCQQKWCFLEPIFSQYEVQRQFASQTTKFRVIDRRWRAIMRTAQKELKVLVATSQSALMPTLIDANKVMENILHSLDGYLDAKRMAFPRFFFLSNEDIFEIIAQSHNPQAIQTYLTKCFDGIKGLEFSNSCDQVYGMINADGERLLFNKTVTVDGQPETWLLNVEDSMQKSLKTIMAKALSEYNRLPFETWIFAYPAQVVFTVMLVAWTRKVHLSLEKESPKDHLMQYEYYLRKRIDSLAELCQKSTLSTLQSNTVRSLLLIDLHCVEVVRKILAMKIEGLYDYEWTKHLRYFYDEKKHRCYVRQANSVLYYGYEFIGTTARMVLTPQTERMHLAITEALQGHYGVHVIGPSGSGKTEIVQNLSRSLGRLHINFNCSESLSFKSISRILAGMIQVGAWGSFDSIAKLEPSTLFVLSQNLKAISDSAAEHAERVMFEGKSMRIDDNFAFFAVTDNVVEKISELPMYMRSILRPIALSTPDLDVIAEITLQVSGFAQSKSLAKKLVFFYSLINDQMSVPNYKFGTRSIKETIAIATSLKKQDPQRDELSVLVHAIYSASYAHFSSEESKIFAKYLQEVFPSTFHVVSSLLTTKPHAQLRELVSHDLELRGLVAVPYLVDKVVELYEAIKRYRTVIIVGAAQSGKTSVYSTLSRVLYQYEKLNHGGSDIRSTIVHPSVLSANEFVGKFEDETNIWRDGILPKLIRKLHKRAEGEKLHWIVLDGPLNGQWPYQIKSLLEENGTLDLANSERMVLPSGHIDIAPIPSDTVLDLSKAAEAVEESTDHVPDPPTVQFIIETESVQDISPAIISRCGVVYMQPSDIGWESVTHSWINRIFPVATAIPLNNSEYSETKGPLRIVDDELKSLLASMFEKYIEPTIRFVREDCVNGISLNEMGMIENFVSVLEGLLADPEIIRKDSGRRFRINFVVVFSIIWGLGGHLSEKDIYKFDKYVRLQLSDLYHFDNNDNLLVYDYYLADGSVVAWKPLNDLMMSHSENAEGTNAGSASRKFEFVLNKILLYSKKHILLAGPEGSGKTTLMDSISSNPTYVLVPISLSHLSTAQYVQKIIETKFTKLSSNFFGPPVGKHIILQLHNLNIVDTQEKENSASEFLRQLITEGGFYDRKTLAFIKVQGFQIIATFNSEMRSEQGASQRLLQHFFIMSLPAPSDETIKSIFYPIVKEMLLAFSSSDLVRLKTPLLDATIFVLRSLSQHKLAEDFTNRNIYNLHHLMQVFNGMQLFKPADKTSVEDILRLWRNEMMRVFTDGLSSESERTWFSKLLTQSVSTFFKISETEFELDVLFLDPTASSWHPLNPSADVTSNVFCLLFSYNKGTPVAVREKEYREFDREDVKITFAVIQEKHKELEKLVLFNSFVDHVSRVSRVIRQNKGNVVLLGGYGSGKTSVISFASALAGYEVMSSKTTRTGYADFLKDFKSAMISAGIEEKPIVFVIEDEHVNMELMDQVVDFMQIGASPLLFNLEETEKIIQDVRINALMKGISSEANEVFAFFLQNVQRNLHFVFCFKPNSPIYNETIYKFPCLANYCYFDYIAPWNSSDLMKVVGDFVQKEPFMEEVAIHSQALCNIAAEIHTSSLKLSANSKSFGIHTSAKLVDFVRLYINTFKEKRDTFLKRLSSHKNGLAKIQLLNSFADNIRNELQTLKPLLQKVVEDTKKLEDAIGKNTKTVEEFFKAVREEEIQMNAKNAESSQLAEDAKKAQEEFDKVVPALNAAIAGLRSLNKNDIAELKVFLPNPPERIQKVLEAVCILRGVTPSPQEIVTILNDSLIWMITYNKENVNSDTIVKLKKYIINPEFTPNGIETKAAKWLCHWVIGIYRYANVYKAVQPKRAKIAEMDAQLQDGQKSLKEKQKLLQQAEEKLDQFKDVHKSTNERKIQLEVKSNDLVVQLARAEKLIESLEGREADYTAKSKDLENKLNLLIGDVLLYSAFIIYLGSYDPSIRKKMLRSWHDRCQELQLPTSDNFSVDIFSSSLQIREWHKLGLPIDPESIENAILIRNHPKWTYIFDPEGQAAKWIKNIERSNQIKIIDPDASNFVRTIEGSVAAGRPVIVENIRKTLHPELVSLLITYGFNGKKDEAMINFGGKDVQYNEGFRLYIISPYRLVELPDDVRSKVNIVDFSLGRMGLEDQLLALVLRQERSDIQQQKDTLVERILSDLNELEEMENKTLKEVSQTEGNLLDNELAVNELYSIRGNTGAVEKRIQQSKELEQRTDDTREQYRAVANRGAILYEILRDYANVNPMYQIGLQQFLVLFKNTLLKSIPSAKIPVRINNLLKDLNSAVYAHFASGLPNEHRILFAFLIACKTQRSITASDIEWNLLINPDIVPSKQVPEDRPTEKWVSTKLWENFTKLERVCSGIAESFVSHLDEWKFFIESEKPSLGRTLPNEWDTRVDGFRRLVILRCILDIKLIYDEIIDYTKKQLDSTFLDPLAFSIEKAYSGASSSTPVLFLLEDGCLDPYVVLNNFAQAQGMRERFHVISLDNASIDTLDQTLHTAIGEGHWILLKNCQFNPELLYRVDSNIINSTVDAIHVDFRLWISSTTISDFPVSLLQRSIKYTTEPPTRIKNSMITLYRETDDMSFNACKKPTQYRRLTWALNFFHSILWCRRKYDHLGWSSHYNFNHVDHSITLEKMRQYLNVSEDRNVDVPYKDLLALTSEVYYGGHVSNARELQVLKYLLTDFFTPLIMEEKYAFTPKETYHLPADGGIAIDSYLNQLPLFDDPEVLGYHDNMKSLHNYYEGREFFLSFQKMFSLTNETNIHIHLDKIKKVDELLPAKVEDNSNVPREGFLAIVLVQEVEALNKMLSTITKCIKQLKYGLEKSFAAIKPLESIYHSIIKDEVPSEWKYYPSNLSLTAWLKDLAERVAFFQHWLDVGQPTIMWIGAFAKPRLLFTHIFLQGARKAKAEVETLTLEVEFLSAELAPNPAEEGVFVSGMYMEGARLENSKLEELEHAGPIYQKMPIMLIKAKPPRTATGKQEFYPCPIYTSSSREADQLVNSIKLQTQQTEKHWSKRGVVLLTHFDVNC